MVDKRVRLAVRHPWRPMKAIIPLWLTNDEVRSIHRDDERRNPSMVDERRSSLYP